MDKAPSPGRHPPWDLILFVALVAAYLGPIWSLDYFGTQDGPAHVDSAHVLMRLGVEDPEAVRAVYDSSFQAIPNLTAQYCLAAFDFVLEPVQGEKLLLSLYLLLFAAGLSLSLTAVDRQARFLSFIGFPLAYPWYLNKGFYSYALGVALCLLLTCWWLRNRRRPTSSNGIALAAAFVVLYFTHAAALVASFIILATISAGEAFVAWTVRRSKPPSVRGGDPPGRFVRELLFLAIGFAPAFFLLNLFLAANWVEGPDFAVANLQMWRLRALDMRYLLVSYSDLEYSLAPAFGFVLLLLAAAGLFRRLRRGGLRAGDSLLACAFVLGVVCLVVPGRLLGGEHLFARLLVFPVLMFLVWLATVDWSRRQKIFIRWTGAACSLLFLGALIAAKSDLQPFIHEYLSVRSQLERDSRFLTVNLSPAPPHDPLEGPARRVRPFLHLSGYLAAATGAINLSNYQGWTGHFPLRWRPEATPFRSIPTPPNVGLREVERFLARRDLDSVDYLLVWYLGSGGKGQETWRKTGEQLASRFDLIFTSRPHGWARLFKRRGHEQGETDLLRNGGAPGAALPG